MSLNSEKITSLHSTRRFLSNIVNKKLKCPKDLREQAESVLLKFPSHLDIIEGFELGKSVEMDTRIMFIEITREFLYAIAYKKRIDRLTKNFASSCLRHYPSLIDFNRGLYYSDSLY